MNVLCGVAQRHSTQQESEVLLLRYAKIREIDISNGEGIGVALFVQGCHFHCKGCFNPETWDFDGGHTWDDETIRKFKALIDRPFIKRVTVLGGEPLADENVFSVFSILFESKLDHPDKSMWLYTGYNVDEIVAKRNDGDVFDFGRFQAIKCADVVVDGQFQIEHQDLFNKQTKWAGSTNQRIIRMEDYWRGGTNNRDEQRRDENTIC